jgi:hypothetical protein
VLVQLFSDGMKFIKISSHFTFGSSLFPCFCLFDVIYIYIQYLLILASSNLSYLLLIVSGEKPVSEAYLTFVLEEL